MEKAIIVDNVKKKYKLYNNSKERFLDLLTPKEYGEEFYALAGVDFEADQGEVIGFIGINGSGKSTLSNIIAGIVPETSGAVKTNGQVSIIAVAAGLKGDLTGRDNIELKLLMLGFNKHEIMELENEIIEFSELGNFIDQPVKSYSSGMKSRLGFAISVTVDPDILIIDEALSVGDKAFAEKSLEKMKEFKAEGKTMIFVSHSIGQMKRFCDKLLWLEYGMIKDFGSVEDVMPKYEKFLNTWKLMNKAEREKYRTEALEIQKNILKGSKLEYKIDVNDYYTERNNTVYKEELISLLARIKKTNANLYDHPEKNNVVDSVVKHYKKVLYVKKQGILNSEKFYLLSTEPSAVNGVLGWIKAKDVKVHRHVFVDNDVRTFKFKGTGRAYNKPWGGENDIVLTTLDAFEGNEFEVVQTDLVGKNIWYKGLLQNKYVWINYKHFNNV